MSAFSNRRIIIAWNLEYKIVTSRLGELTLIAVSFVVWRCRADQPSRSDRTDHYSTMWSTICSSVGKCTQFIDSYLNNIRNRFMHTCAYSPLFIRNNDLKYTIRTSLTKLKNIMRFWHLSLISWFFPNTHQYMLLTLMKTIKLEVSLWGSKVINWNSGWQHEEWTTDWTLWWSVPSGLLLHQGCRWTSKSWPNIV